MHIREKYVSAYLILRENSKIMMNHYNFAITIKYSFYKITITRHDFVNPNEKPNIQKLQITSKY